MQTLQNLITEWVPRLQAFGVLTAGLWSVWEFIKSQQGNQAKEQAKQHIMWIVGSVIGMYVVLEIIKQVSGSLG